MKARTPPPYPAKQEGGLFHDVDPIPGTEVFNLYTSDGIRRGRWEAAEGFTDGTFLDAMRELHERKDDPPAPALQIVGPDAETTDGQPEPEGMTAARLVAEARRNRVEDAPVVNVPEALTLLLELVLGSFDYELQRSSTPAVVARALAILIANLEDSRVKS